MFLLRIRVPELVSVDPLYTTSASNETTDAPAKIINFVPLEITFSARADEISMKNKRV